MTISKIGAVTLIILFSLLVSSGAQSQSFLSAHMHQENEPTSDSLSVFVEPLELSDQEESSVSSKLEEKIEQKLIVDSLPDLGGIDQLIQNNDFSSVSNQLEEIVEKLETNIIQRLVDDSISKKKLIRAALLVVSKESDSKFQYKRYVNLISDGIRDIELSSILLSQIKESYFLSRLMIRQIELLIKNGDNESALKLVTEMSDSSGYTDGIYGELQHLREMIFVAVDVNPTRIGVILPLSHRRFGPLARQVLDGLELYLTDKFPDQTDIELVIKDPYAQNNFQKKQTSIKSEEVDPKERTDNLVKELVENDKVIAIIGPLTRSNSITAGEAAKKYLVPVISFSLTENIGESSPFLFRFQKNTIEEARTLIAYSADYLGAKRFLVFYDATKSGLRQLKEVIGKIEAKGGEITGAVRIKKKQADFQDGLLAATGGLRFLSEEEIAEMQQTRDRVESIVDFDAMFIPVDQTKYALLNSFISLFDMNSVWKLAGSELNTNENKLLQYTRRLRFVDSFPSGKLSRSLGSFFEKHWKYFGHRPDYREPSSYTIYGYEILDILDFLIKNPTNTTRPTLANSLRILKEKVVLTGLVSTEDDGEITKALKLLKIRDQGTIEVF